MWCISPGLATWEFWVHELLIYVAFLWLPVGIRICMSMLPRESEKGFRCCLAARWLVGLPGGALLAQGTIALLQDCADDHGTEPGTGESDRRQ